MSAIMARQQEKLTIKKWQKAFKILPIYGAWQALQHLGEN